VIIWLQIVAYSQTLLEVTGQAIRRENLTD